MLDWIPSGGIPAVAGTWSGLEHTSAAANPWSVELIVLGTQTLAALWADAPLKDMRQRGKEKDELTTWNVSNTVGKTEK